MDNGKRQRPDERPNGGGVEAPGPDADDVTYQPESGVPVPDENQEPHRDRPSEEDI
jgi:hypothetical protein